MIEIKVKIDIPGADGREYPLNQELWRKLKLPLGWEKRAMYKHQLCVKLVGQFDDIEKFSSEELQGIAATLLLIKNRT